MSEITAQEEITAQDMALQAGTLTGLSDWVMVPQERISRFADATDDWQYIHVDPDAAKDTVFGQTIAHGFLTLGLLPMMMANSTLPKVKGKRMGINYGCNKLRFLAPVKSGKRVRGHFTLIEMFEKQPGRWQQVFACTVEIEGEEKPALAVEWILQFLL